MGELLSDDASSDDASHDALSSRERGAVSERDILRALTDAIDGGSPVVVATVIETSRSVPRRPGSKMLVHPDGSTIGSVGGGEMEGRVVAASLDAFTDGKPRRVRYDLVDAASGDPGVCGGTVDLYLEPYMPTPTVYVIGCGHVGRAVVDLAHWLGFRVVAVDDRVALATAEHIPHADAIICGHITDALAKEPIGTQTSVVLVTRNVAVDLGILPHILATDALYIGVMGSRRRWETTRAQLIDAGLPASQVDRVSTPIGLEINAETPEEIAVSIMAEIVARRRA